MAQRRPITSHPAFAPLLASWFAALLGLSVAVLPAVLLARLVDGSGLAALVPPMPDGRLVVSAAAALTGAIFGWVLAKPLARRGMRDPRPIYDESEPLITEAAPAEPARRPLLARDDLPDEGPDEDTGAMRGNGWPLADAEDEASPPGSPQEPIPSSQSEGFMILGPQPSYSSRPASGLEALLEQFDSALAAFRADAEENQVEKTSEAGVADPVHAFVAQQTGTSAPMNAPSPLGGRMPHHQAELRIALDKLTRAKRED